MAQAHVRQGVGAAGALLLLLSICAGVPAAGAQTPPPQLAPNARAILHQSFAAMQASLHEVHVRGSYTIVQRGKTAMLQVTGDCVWRSGHLTARLRMRGTHFIGNTIQAEDARFVWIGGHFWERLSTKTHNRWQRADSSNDALMILGICPDLPSFAGNLEQTTPPNLTNLGLVRLGSYQTWHLQSLIKGSTIVYGQGKTSFRDHSDFFIDQSSLYLVRMAMVDHAVFGANHSEGSRNVLTFSRFNVPVTITKPRPGT